MCSLDLINKVVKQCGCVTSSKLDIIENEITESTIKLCKNHYMTNFDKLQFTYNKSQNIYISNLEISSMIIKNKIKKMSSDIDINIDKDDYHILQFGKYKSKSFNYVYNNDKLYCYNLSFWKHHKIKNINNKAISEFVNYIREEIKNC